MSWESCVVLLNSDSTGSFYSGDIVTGSVVLEFKKDQKVENITFKVLGICRAQWSRSMPTMPYVKIYSEKNTVLEYDIDVFNEICGKRVKKGIITFHFHFLLPGDAPSTFKSAIAEVSYVIKIEGKAYCKLKCNKNVPFTVYGNINLNHLEEYLVPTFIESKKCFWRSGSFSLSLKTFTGFAPKQHIPFEITLVNEQKVKINKINIILVQKLEYRVTSGRTNEEKKIYKIEHRKFSQTVTEKCYLGMEVPETLPSSIHLLDPMIEICYVLKVEVVFAFHRTLSVDIPVTIATIPVMHHDFNEIENKFI